MGKVLFYQFYFIKSFQDREGGWIHKRLSLTDQQIYGNSNLKYI